MEVIVTMLEQLLLLAITFLLTLLAQPTLIKKVIRTM